MIICGTVVQSERVKGGSTVVVESTIAVVTIQTALDLTPVMTFGRDVMIDLTIKDPPAETVRARAALSERR